MTHPSTPPAGSGLPRPAVTGAAVATRAALKRARSGMPWLRPDDIVSYDGDGGPFCDLTDDAGLPVGTALWDKDSGIRARLLSTTRTRDPLGLLITRLERAEHRRSALIGSDPHAAVRLCHGEADAVPGLFVDRFGDGLHVDVDAAGLLPWLDELLAGTIARQQSARVVLRPPHGSGAQTTQLLGTSSMQTYHHDRLQLEVDLAGNDIRRLSAELDAMSRLRPWAKGRVLDVYANTGGFGLHLAAAGAQQAVLVDESPALPERARTAALKNGLANKVDVVTAEPVAWLKQVQTSFDVVVCHPPHEALPREKAEKRAVDIATSALKHVNEGAIFCARSASASLDDERFAAALQDAGTQLRRRLQVLARLGPGPDHPTLAGTPMPPSILVMRVLNTG
ncbi:MAG: methyltransferase domain-containing protein [Deltaproteobacteria bacterium]|nr:methyltransferase domain-containing protein [Deltaproteobacteria bacterium]